jgi:hypothetical protein
VNATWGSASLTAFKFISKLRETFVSDRLLWLRRFDGKSPMRILVSVLILCAAAVPCSAQTILKSEPLMLAPYEVVFVRNASCPSGQVLKVTGVIRGLSRKRVCVALPSEEASLAVATP